MKVIIQVEQLKVQLTADNEQSIKMFLFDHYEPDEVVTLIVGRDKEQIMLKDLFNL